MSFFYESIRTFTISGLVDFARPENTEVNIYVNSDCAAYDGNQYSSSWTYGAISGNSFSANLVIDSEAGSNLGLCSSNEIVLEYWTDYGGEYLRIPLDYSLTPPGFILDPIGHYFDGTYMSDIALVNDDALDHTIVIDYMSVNSGAIWAKYKLVRKSDCSGVITETLITDYTDSTSGAAIHFGVPDTGCNIFLDVYMRDDYFSSASDFDDMQSIQLWSSP